jgi:hypothetical protein
LLLDRAVLEERVRLERQLQAQKAEILRLTALFVLLQAAVVAL